MVRTARITGYISDGQLSIRVEGDLVYRRVRPYIVGAPFMGTLKADFEAVGIGISCSLYVETIDRTHHDGNSVFSVRVEAISFDTDLEQAILEVRGVR